MGILDATLAERIFRRRYPFFVLNRTDYEQAVKVGNDEAISKDPEGAGLYSIPVGIVGRAARSRTKGSRLTGWSIP